MNPTEFMQLVAGHSAGCTNSRNVLFQFLCSNAREVFLKKFRNNNHDWDEVYDVLLKKVEKLLEYQYEKLKQETVLAFISKSFFNAILDYCRRKSNNKVCFSRLNSKSMDDYDGEGFDFEDSIADDCEADDKLLENECNSFVKRGISKLSVQQKMVMEMLLIQGLSDEQVMEKMSLDSKLFHVVKSTGKSKLLKWLKKSGVR